MKGRAIPRFLFCPGGSLFPILLLVLALASHVLPHPWWNFTAVGGSLLFWGARLPLRSHGASWRDNIATLVAYGAIPVTALAVGDWYLTRFVYGYPFHVSAYLLTWTWYALVVTLGALLLRGKPGFARVAGSALLASTSFFAVSNYAVWASPGSWYPHSVAGLEACYALALPFYRNDLLSTLCVVGVIWGIPALVARTRAPENSASARG